MDIYYKIKKDSPIGEKFSELLKRSDFCFDATLKFLEKYGFDAFRQGYDTYEGGITSCCNPIKPVDTKVWKPSGHGKDEYMPKLNTKIGKAIMEEINNLPTVGKNELNDIVGFKGNKLNTQSIGFYQSPQEYYGIIINDSWDIDMPIDCEEITVSEFINLFIIPQLHESSRN